MISFRIFFFVLSQAFFKSLLFLSFLSLPIWTFAQPYEYVMLALTQDSSDYVNTLMGHSMSIYGEEVMIGTPRDFFDEQGQDPKWYAGAVYLMRKDPAGYWQHQQKLVAPERQNSGQFGRAVAFQPGRAVISHVGYRVDTVNQIRGLVHIYEPDASGYWREVATLNPSGRMGGNWADDYGEKVALDGNRILVSAHGRDYFWDPNDSSQFTQANGRVYLFEQDSSGAWQEAAILEVPDSSDFNFFGFDMAIEGDLVVVGAYEEDEDENGQNTLDGKGAAYVFQPDSNGNWSLRQKLVAPYRSFNNGVQFGRSVGISGDQILIGDRGAALVDPLTGNQIYSAGSVGVFTQDSTGRWEMTQQLFSQDPFAYDEVGREISVNGNLMVVGAHQDNGPAGPDQGAVYVFERQADGQWLEIDKIVDPNPIVDGELGRGPAVIDGPTAIAVRVATGPLFYEVCASNHELIKVQACEPMDYYGHWLDSTGLYENLALEVDWNCDSLSADVQFDLIEVDTAVVRQGDSLVAMAVGAEFQWIRCGQGWPELPGETDSVFVPDSMGFYAVLVDQSGCQEQSGCFFWAPPLVSAEASLTSRLRLYPNPSSGQATLDLSSLTQPAELRIYDARGRWLGSLERLRGSVEVDLRKFGSGPGLYVIQVQAGEEMEMMKMVWE